MKVKVKHVVKPILGKPHYYIVVSSDGVTEYQVNLVDRSGHGNCECPGFEFHVLRSGRLECCSHISDAREYELSLSGGSVNQPDLVNCDACGQTKPIEVFSHPGHLPGGQYICGADIDSSVCNQCAERNIHDTILEPNSI